MFPEIPALADVKGRLQIAIDRFMEADRWLLQVSASERSVSHRLALHLQAVFRDWHVDCEYNRIGAARKAIDIPKDPIAWDDTEAKTVFPDIIVHQRGQDGLNVLVIEMKKDDAPKAEFDRTKLRAFVLDLSYEFAVFLRFTTGDDGHFLEAEWFELGT